MMLEAEYSIILELSRVTGEINANIIKSQLEKGVDWEKIVRVATKNKVLSLVYHNLKRLNLADFVPRHYTILLEDNFSCNYMRNENKLLELQKIQKIAIQKKVAFAPVKGGYLIDNVYSNRRIRITNDIDVLIRRSDIKKIDDIMKECGYEYGEYDPQNNKIVSPDRNKLMLYKTKMYDLLPYIKLNADIIDKKVMFDFSFALDFSLDTRPVDEMLDMAEITEQTMVLQPEHFLIHMCCHHYREASNVAWILLGKDLNLIKFCDVREYILQKMDSYSISQAIEFAKKYKLEKAMYFTIYFVREIYHDGYETNILNSLDIEDESFLYQFGEKDYEELQTRKKDFWTSLFSMENTDEIVNDPKYKKLI